MVVWTLQSTEYICPWDSAWGREGLFISLLHRDHPSYPQSPQIILIPHLGTKGSILTEFEPQCLPKLNSLRPFVFAFCYGFQVSAEPVENTLEKQLVPNKAKHESVTKTHLLRGVTMQVRKKLQNRSKPTNKQTKTRNVTISSPTQRGQTFPNGNRSRCRI